MRELLTKLTPQAAFRLTDADYLLFDGQPGLMLVAGRGEPKSRSYTWYFRHRAASGLARIKLGRWPALSFADACSERERLDRERQRGVDHAAARKNAKAMSKAEALEAPRQAVTLKQLAEAHLAEKKATRNAKSARDLAIVLKPLTEGELARKRVVEFRPKDALALLYSVAGSAPSSARALRQEMAQATRSAALREVIPAETPNVWDLCRADSVLRARLAPSKRSRVLTDAELATWLAWLPTSKMSERVMDALRFTLMTGARSGEVVAMRRSDVVDGVWSISKTKTDAPRTVRLSLQAVALLERRPGGAWYFQSPAGGHIGQTALVQAVSTLRQTSGLADWSAHDLRRSCRTGLARLGCPREVAEAALGHSKAGIVGVYDLHMYEKEVGAWLQKWCDHLDALQSPNVVPMRKKA